MEEWLQPNPLSSSRLSSCGEPLGASLCLALSTLDFLLSSLAKFSSIVYRNPSLARFFLCSFKVAIFFPYRSGLRKGVSRFLYESHYVPRSPATFDLALTPSPLQMRQAVPVHATKWMHQNITSAAGFDEQLIIELACLQRVIGEQLIHRQPTERKVLIYTFMARSHWLGKKAKCLMCRRVFNSYMNQLIRTPAYLGATCIKEWTEKSLSWTDQRLNFKSDQSCNNKIAKRGPWEPIKLPKGPFKKRKIAPSDVHVIITPQWGCIPIKWKSPI